MHPNRLSLVTRLSCCLTVGLLTATAAAQTPISGALSGTLSPGVYHATNISVAAGQTLTLSAGVIIKFVGARQFIVQGTLISNGIASNPVILTDDDDDSAGGDTNGNGPSVGVPGAWFNIVFQSSVGSTLAHTEVRFAGTSNFTAVDLQTSDVGLFDCTIRNSNAEAMSLRGTSFPTVTNCSFLNNGGHAVDDVQLAAVPGFSNNTSSGNGVDTLRITGASLSANLTLGLQSMLDGAFLLATGVNVPLGVTLTLPAGVILKFEGARQMNVAGTLDCQGAPGNPVILTDDDDDSAGGDTNNNGASTGVPGAWFNLVLQSSSASTLAHTEVRFAGTSNFTAVDLQSSNIAMVNCTIANSNAEAMSLRGNSFPTVTNCSFMNNGGHAVDDVQLAAVPGFSNNTSSGNGVDTLRITGASLGANLTLGLQSMLDGAFLLATGVNVPLGVTLTLPAGAILKFEGARQMNIAGTLDCQGTPGSPVIITDDDDDSAGGDTNNNGASTGVPGAWFNVVFQSSSTSTLAHTEVRFAGTSNFTAVDLQSSDIVMTNCTIADSNASALDLSGNSRPTVTNCAFVDNGNRAVDFVPIQAVPGFINNTATGNQINCLRVTQASVTDSLTIGTESMLGGAFLFATGISVSAVGDLTLQQGVVIKFVGSHQVNLSGAVHFLGTAYEPVVFTDDDDDSIAGDSNGDGPSTGIPGAWFNIVAHAAGLPSTMENVVVRYAGTSNFTAFDCSSPVMSLRAIRVDEAQAAGFRLAGLGMSPANLVAWQCGGRGFHLVNGAFALVHATSTGNATGIRREVAWNGSIINSNCHGNTTNFDGLAAGQVLSSNGGFAGSNGNINADPLFASAAGGDLHLLAGSPCLAAADLTFALMTQKDYDENSRVLDHALGGTALPDMGAFERGNWHMEADNTPRLGETMHLTVQGPSGDSFVAFGIGAPGSAAVLPYGILLAGSLSDIALLPSVVAVGTPIPIAVPDLPGLTGAALCLQAVTLPTGVGGRGNFSELYRLLVRP